MAINFIKNLSQLITGGIGIVDDELVYKDSEGNTKDARGFDTVEEIPETLDPGQIVFVAEAGSLWVGASDDYFPTLDEGTPWPLKGYKEYSGVIQADTSSIDSNRIVVDDFRNIAVSVVADGIARFESNDFGEDLMGISSAMDAGADPLKSSVGLATNQVDLLYETSAEEFYIVNYMVRVKPPQPE